MFPKFEHFFDPESLFHVPTCMNFKNMNLYLSSHLFECRYASEWDPREPGHTKVSQAILVLNSKKERTYFQSDFWKSFQNFKLQVLRSEEVI